MLKNITLKLFPILISLIFILPVLKENILSLTIILLCLNVFLYKIFAKDFSLFPAKNLLLTIPFWIVLLTTLFTSELNSSFLHVRHALFFLVIPIFFSLVPKEFFEQKKIDLYIFVLKTTCLFIAFTYVISFFWKIPAWQYDVVFNNESRFRNYIYNDFKCFIIHPTYYTTILIVCVAHSFDEVLKEKKYLQLTYVFCFLVITTLLLTKLNLLLMILVLTSMIFIRSAYSIKIKMLFTFTMLSLIISFVFFTPGIKNRFIETYESFGVKPANIAFDSTNIRKAIFDSSFEMARKNWLFGVGFDNLQNNLNTTYKKNYNSSFYINHNYMTHNYYFYIFLSSGIIGFLFYLLYLSNIIKICIKTNLFIFKLFVLNALIICFIEDYFYRQYGVLYFNLVLMCFIRHSETIKAQRN